MKIAILGAGFTGLSAAFHLSQEHQVTIFEKEEIPGGLAVSFREEGWKWPLEKHYHHFFTNDTEIIGLAKKINFENFLVYPPSLTSLYYQKNIFPFNTVKDILSFSPLSFLSRIRLGVITALLKILPGKVGQSFESMTAAQFAKRLYGQKVFSVIWEPLLKGKFSEFAEKVNAAWLWARIRKRTLTLGYFQGGYQAFAQALEKSLINRGVKIYYGEEVAKAEQMKNGNWKIETQGQRLTADIVISTLPTPFFLKLFTDLPADYQKRLSATPHLQALNLLLVLDKPFFNKTYWLNINDREFPFLAVVEHTNFIDKKHYGGNHLVYVSNYLPDGHPFLKKTARELLQIYEPYLKKIQNSKFKIQNYHMFVAPYAQPVFLKNYSKVRPYGITPLKNLYFANLDSVYPWDRGTNYALELGRKLAELIGKSQNSNLKT